MTPLPIMGEGGTLVVPALTGVPTDLARVDCDAVVVGAGVAGLAFALSLPAGWRVALLTKGKLGESNTRWAQGGISAAIGADDSPDLHEEDTLVAGAGLCDVDAVHELVQGAGAAVDWLVEIGAEFDRDDATGAILLGREAAHSRRRVLHAGGDATGVEVERALVAKVRTLPNVAVHEGAFAVDLVVEDGRCTGLLALIDGEATRFSAPVVAIAAGGAGRLWATTSNPPAATADGLAIALRAGAAVADLEFVQFHPTVLALTWSAPFLISEAVRGEGAYLRSRDGERFMLAEHPLGELAPRDVVARGIQRQLLEHGPDSAFLDLRHLDADAMRRRFPTIVAQLKELDLDLATDLIPVAPAAHYFMGGIVASTAGETTIPGLLAIGEAACTGVHGANRLASNSLLEGLVFGRKAAARAAELVSTLPRTDLPLVGSTAPDVLTDVAADPRRSDLQAAMSRWVSVVRDADGLTEAIFTLVSLDSFDVSEDSEDKDESGISGRSGGPPWPPSPAARWETANMLLAARSIAQAALLREESRGGHFRSDFPDTDPAMEGVHLVHHAGRGGWRMATLRDVLGPVAMTAAAL